MAEFSMWLKGCLLTVFSLQTSFAFRSLAKNAKIFAFFAKFRFKLFREIINLYMSHFVLHYTNIFVNYIYVYRTVEVKDSFRELYIRI